MYSPTEIFRAHVISEVEELASLLEDGAAEHHGLLELTHAQHIVAGRHLPHPRRHGEFRRVQLANHARDTTNCSETRRRARLARGRRGRLLALGRDGDAELHHAI